MDTPESRRKLLVEALQSGEYKQCSFALCTEYPGEDKGYCCLGVACDVYQKHVGDLVIEKLGHKYMFDDHLHDMPPKVQEWYGFSTGSGMFPDSIKLNGSIQQYMSLIGLNDHGVPFDEIATVIEEGKVMTTS
jgi:hypothetical protein